MSSFHLNHKWTRGICDEINKKLVNVSNPAVIDYLELNAVRNRSGDYEGKFNGYLPQIQNGEYDMVVAILDDAIDLIMKNYELFPKNLPFIFVAIRELPEKFNETHPNITGFVAEYDMVGTVDLVLKLYPETKEIAIITDDFISGIYLDKLTKKKLAGFEGCKIIFLNGADYTSQQVVKRVGEMSRDSVVIFAPWRNFAKDGYLSLENMAYDLSNVTPHPFFVMTDVLLGYGSLGGFLLDGGLQGQELVEMITRILGSERMASEVIPFQKSSVRCIIDMELFRKEKLDSSLLPSTVVKFNDNPPFYIEYPLTTLLSVLFVMILLMFLIVIATMYRRFKNRSALQLAKVQQLRQKAEELSEKQWIILNSIGDALIVTDRNERITQVNPVAEKLVGLAETEMVGEQLESVIKLLSRVDGVKVLSPLFLAIDTGEVIEMSEDTDLVSKSGVRRHVSTNASPIFSKSGEIIGGVMIFRDITLESRQRESIAVALKALENAAELAQIEYYQTDANGTIIKDSNENRLNWGYRNGVPVSVSEWVHPDDLENYNRSWERLYRSTAMDVRINYRSCFDGVVRYFVMMVSLIADSSGGGTHKYSCVIQDITEIGESERDLKETTELFRTILDRLPCMIFVKDVSDNFKYIIANSMFCRSFGLRNENIMNLSDMDIFPSDIATKFRREDIIVVNDGNDYTCVDYVNGSGQELTMQVGKAIFTTSGGKKLLIGVAVDISEREAAKQRILESEQLLRAMIDNALIGIFLKDPENDYKYVMWNTELSRCVGIPISEVEGRNDRECNIYPGAADSLREQDVRVMESNQSLVSEDTLSLPNGGKIVYQTAKVPITLPGGKRYLLGSSIDISDLRNLTIKQEEIVARQRALIRREKVYSECLLAISSQDDFATSIQKTLAILGAYCGAERCFVVCRHRTGSFADGSFEWMLDGLEPQLDTWSAFDNTATQEIWNELNTKRCGRIDGVSENVSVYEALRESAQGRFDLRSVLLCSIFDEDDFWGFIAIGSVHEKRRFGKENEEMLMGWVKLFSLAQGRARQQEALDNALYWHRMILGNIDIPILLFDLSGSMISVNQAACDFMGITEEEAINLPCYATICQERCVPDFCPVRKALNSKEVCSAELLSRGRELTIVAKPLFDADGDIMYILAYALDMTDFNQNGRKLLEAMKSAQAADLAKNNFISTMNHELRTPLNAIIGFSELLQMGETDEDEQKEYLHSINLSGKSLLNLVNDVLDISRLDAGSMNFLPIKTDCVELFSEMGRMFSSSAKDKGIDFSFIMPLFLPSLFIDPARLRQIVLNLVGNALKFTNIGKVVVSLRFAGSNGEDGVLQMSIEDTGIGIKKEFLPRIFDSFTQDDQVRGSRAYQGSGLGLAITKKLIEAMKGTVTVESYENIGSIFTVKIENLKYEDVDVDEKRLYSKYAGEKIRLLVVDDVPENLKMIESLFRRLGHVVCCAGTVAEALDMMEGVENFDAVLTDMCMPGMSAIEFAEAIRRKKNGSFIPLYAANGDMNWKPEATIPVQFNRVFSKPLTISDVQILLEDVIE